MTQQEYENKIKILEKALQYAVKSAEKESCYYCPINENGNCKLKEDSEQCYNHIMETFIKRSKEELGL